MTEKKPTWQEVKDEFRKIGKDKYDSEETREEKTIRKAQKKLSAADDPSVYGKFLENSAELDRFQVAVSVTPLIFISAFLFNNLERLKGFSLLSKYYVVAWVVYSAVMLLAFTLARYEYLSSRTLLSMPLEFWVYAKEGKTDKVQRKRVDLKRTLAQEALHKWSRRLVFTGAIVSTVGVMITAWEVWKLIR